MILLAFIPNYVYVVKIIKIRSDYFAVTAGYDNQITLYNIQTKKIVNSHKLGYKLQFLATSKENIAICGFGKEIKIYDFNLNPIKTIISETEPSGLAYSPNGKLLIAGAGDYPNNINIYNVNQNYKKIQSFKKNTNLTMAVAFLDNQTVVSGGGDNNEIYVWNIKKVNDFKKIEGVGKSVWSVGAKGEIIAWGNKDCGSNNCKKLQKSINLKTFQISEHGVNSSFHKVSTTYKNYLLLHRRGGNYNLADGVLDIKEDGKREASIVKDSTDGQRHNCYGFYKNYIVSGGANGFLKIYNLKGKEVANLVGHTGEVFSIALDGDRLISGSNDQTIRVWDLGKLKIKSGKRKIDEKLIALTMKQYNISREKILEIAKNNNNLYNYIYIAPIIQPQLNLFISKTNDWIAWTPKGYYNASKEGAKYVGFHINHGAEHEAEFFTAGDVKRLLYRPDIVADAWRGEDISKEEKKITTEALFKAREPLNEEKKITTEALFEAREPLNKGWIIFIGTIFGGIFLIMVLFWVFLMRRYKK